MRLLFVVFPWHSEIGALGIRNFPARNTAFSLDTDCCEWAMLTMLNVFQPLTAIVKESVNSYQAPWKFHFCCKWTKGYGKQDHLQHRGRISVSSSFSTRCSSCTAVAWTSLRMAKSWELMSCFLQPGKAGIRGYHFMEYTASQVRFTPRQKYVKSFLQSLRLPIFWHET